MMWLSVSGKWEIMRVIMANEMLIEQVKLLYSNNSKIGFVTRMDYRKNVRKIIRFMLTWKFFWNVRKCRFVYQN